MADTHFLNKNVKLTVVKTLKVNDIAEKYNQTRPGDASEEILPDCPFFKEGQEFVVFTDPLGNCKPEGFCDWAWADLWKDILMVATKAGFVENGERGGIRPHFACCTDGLRPVVFCLEALDD